MTKPQHAVDISEAVERISLLTALTEFRALPGAKRVLDTPITPRSFRRIEPFIAREVYADREDEYVMLAAGEVKPADLDGPLRVAMTVDNTGDADGFGVCRLTAVTPKQARGRLHRPYRYVVDDTALLIDSDGTGVVHRGLVGSNDGVRWEMASNVYKPIFDQTVADRVSMGHSVQFTQQFFWHVELGWVGYPTVLIPTDPTGVRAVFRLRDIPEGKARRAALRHWVTEHMRQNRRDDGEEIRVREHLRGATQFTWNGLICNVEVSRSDLARAERAKQDREPAA